MRLKIKTGEGGSKGGDVECTVENEMGVWVADECETGWEGGVCKEDVSGYIERRGDQRRAGTILRSIRRVVLLMNSIGANSASAHLRTAVDALKN